MRAVILAGGAGSRIAALFPDLPKPLIPICGKPVLERQIETLRREGVTDFTLVTGYLADQIMNYFGDGEKWGVKIEYFRETEPLGTAGALFRMRFDDDFLLLGGDLIFDFDLSRMLAFHQKNNALATLFAHPNAHPYDSALLAAEENGEVTAFLPKESAAKPRYYENLCNAGVQIISPELLSRYRYEGRAELDRQVIAPAVDSGRIFAYRSAEYVKDMGTPDRYAKVSRDLENGVVGKSNIKNKRPAVFLDRDGTLNVYKGLVTRPEQLELLDGAAEAIRRLNEAGIPAVLVTNQPVIARGDCTFEELREIHNKLETLLGEKGAYLDRIYFCPHHPDAGFPGERPEYKITCDCRKPKPGLLLRAAEEMNLELSRSYMVGDSATDIEAGRRAGCIPVFLKCGKPGDAPGDCAVYEDLMGFVADKF